MPSNRHLSSTSDLHAFDLQYCWPEILTGGGQNKLERAVVNLYCQLKCTRKVSSPCNLFDAALN